MQNNMYLRTVSKSSEIIFSKYCSSFHTITVFFVVCIYLLQARQAVWRERSPMKWDVVSTIAPRLTPWSLQVPIAVTPSHLSLHTPAPPKRRHAPQFDAVLEPFPVVFGFGSILDDASVPRRTGAPGHVTGCTHRRDAGLVHKSEKICQVMNSKIKFDYNGYGIHCWVVVVYSRVCCSESHVHYTGQYPYLNKLFIAFIANTKYLFVHRLLY